MNGERDRQISCFQTAVASSCDSQEQGWGPNKENKRATISSGVSLVGFGANPLLGITLNLLLIH